jgi:hypothetical protein
MKIPFLNFGNKEQEAQKVNTPFAPYEEVSEKKTTKLGYFLLLIMVILGVWQGQGFISSLASNIKSPDSMSSCAYYFKNIVDKKNNTDSYNQNYYYGYSGNGIKNCVYNTFEKENSFPAIVAEISPLVQKVETLNKSLEYSRNSSYNTSNSINNLKQNYNISLNEKIAGEGDTVYDKTEVKQGLSQNESRLDFINKNIAELESDIKQTNTQIENIVLRKEVSIQKAFSDYTKEVKWVDFERALLLFVLISPILYLSIKKYFKLKKENSQYSIIWAAISAIFALLFAQVFFAFIYKIIPHEFLAKLIRFFGQFSFLVTILQYLLLLLTPAIFGFVVYLIQKKVYNKEAVMIRSLKNHKCPACSMSLRESDRYCSVCHYQIKEKCLACNGDRTVGLKYCGNCGVSKEV